MSDTTFTFRLDANLKKQFALAANARDRSGAQLLREFMREVVQQQQDAMLQDAWFRQEVAIGRKAADNADLLSNDEVEAEAAAWRAAVRRSLADPTV